MFFRFRLMVVSLVVAVVWVLGCAGEGEKSSNPPDITFDSPKFQCLSQTDQTLSRYLQGTLPDSEVQAFWNCLDLAVVQFLKYVRGSEGQNYTPREMAQFLDQYFLDQRGLASETQLLAEFMEVKRLFVGGTVDRVSYADLHVRTRELLQDFKTITLDLNSHMKALRKGLVGTGEEVSGSEAEAAVQALRRTGEKLAALFKKGEYFYSFTHLKALLTELEAFLQKKSPDFGFSNGLRYLPLFGELKGLLVAPPQDLIRNQDWPRLLENLSTVLGWVVRYNVHIKDKDWSQGTAFEVFSGIMLGVVDELEKGVRQQPNAEFSLTDLDRLVDMLGELDLIPFDISAGAAKELLRHVLEKVLDPQGGLDHGLNKGDLNALRSELQRWIEAQHFSSQALLLPGILDTAAPTGAAEEMRMLMRTRWPLLRDQAGRLIFSPDTVGGHYDQLSLSTLNWQRALVRALMRGYAVQTNPDGATGLTVTELTVLLKEWQALAEKLGLFESGQSERAAKKIFLEANLFMPSSNGDERLDFVEAVQYVAFVISGLNSASQMEKGFKGRCDLDDGAKGFKAACVREEVFHQRQDLLSNFPLLLRFLGQDSAKWLAFEGHIENTTRDGLSDRPFTKGELVEMVVLIHYIETYFGNFDKNGNQKINAEETLDSFPVFHRSLAEIVKNSFGFTMSTDDLKGLLTYLFNYGEPPQSSFAGMLKFLNWRWNPDRWTYDEGRMRVVQILAELNGSR